MCRVGLGTCRCLWRPDDNFKELCLLPREPLTHRAILPTHVLQHFTVFLILRQGLCCCDRLRTFCVDQRGLKLKRYACLSLLSAGITGLSTIPGFFFFFKIRSVGALASVLAGRETNLSLARLTQAGSNFGNLVPGDLLPAYLNTVQFGEKFSGVVQSLVYKEILLYRNSTQSACHFFLEDGF